MARKKVEEEREEEEDRVGEGCCGLTVCKYTLCVYNFIFLVSTRYTSLYSICRTVIVSICTCTVNNYVKV